MDSGGDSEEGESAIRRESRRIVEPPPEEVRPPESRFSCTRFPSFALDKYLVIP